MSRLTLSLAFHNHQPVGNFPSVFEQAYRQAYEPMVGALERHPGVRVALHYTGPLLDWLREAHPDLLSRVRALVARGQVEVMTGGYYEPILPAIPDRDKHGQILKMTRAVRGLFGYEATGLWLAERVWEPHLPKALAGAGVAYTIVDDTHFVHVGLTGDELTGHFITEEDGATVAILPSAKPLRYRIPWATVPDLMQWLRGQTADDDRVLVMGDDGEKFGLWPGTHTLCWDRGRVARHTTTGRVGEDDAPARPHLPADRVLRRDDRVGAARARRGASAGAQARGAGPGPRGHPALPAGRLLASLPG
jgi:alpha-amylase